MKRIARFGSLIAAFTLLSTLAVAAPKAQRANKYFDVSGKVIQIDKNERTFLVTEQRSNKLYLINVPDGATFKITFGRYMTMAEPDFDSVRTGERIIIRCKRTDSEHLARLDDGRTVTVLTAAP